MMIEIQKFVFNPFQQNTYVVWDGSGECVIIDPGCKTAKEQDSLFSFIGGKGLKPAAILLTHGHLDHVFGVRAACEKYGIPAYMHPAEEASIKEFNVQWAPAGMSFVDEFSYQPIADGQLLHFGNSDVRVLATPGHSMGGVCYWFEAEGVLFSGDTLFAGSIGRTDNNWASLDLLKKSLKEVLMALDGEIDVLPGHGPATSIGRERLLNPFINEEFGDLGYEM